MKVKWKGPYWHPEGGAPHVLMFSFIEQKQSTLNFSQDPNRKECLHGLLVKGLKHIPFGECWKNGTTLRLRPVVPHKAVADFKNTKPIGEIGCCEL